MMSMNLKELIAMDTGRPMPMSAGSASMGKRSLGKKGGSHNRKAGDSNGLSGESPLIPCTLKRLPSKDAGLIMCAESASACQSRNGSRPSSPRTQINYARKREHQITDLDVSRASTGSVCSYTSGAGSMRSACSLRSNSSMRSMNRGASTGGTSVDISTAVSHPFPPVEPSISSRSTPVYGRRDPERTSVKGQIMGNAKKGRQRLAQKFRPSQTLYADKISTAFFGKIPVVLFTDSILSDTCDQTHKDQIEERKMREDQLREERFAEREEQLRFLDRQASRDWEKSSKNSKDSSGIYRFNSTTPVTMTPVEMAKTPLCNTTSSNMGNGSQSNSRLLNNGNLKTDGDTNRNSSGSLVRSKLEMRTATVEVSLEPSPTGERVSPAGVTVFANPAPRVEIPTIPSENLLSPGVEIPKVPAETAIARDLVFANDSELVFAAMPPAQSTSAKLTSDFANQVKSTSSDFANHMLTASTQCPLERAMIVPALTAPTQAHMMPPTQVQMLNPVEISSPIPKIEAPGMVHSTPDKPRINIDKIPEHSSPTKYSEFARLNENESPFRQFLSRSKFASGTGMFERAPAFSTIALTDKPDWLSVEWYERRNREQFSHARPNTCCCGFLYNNPRNPLACVFVGIKCGNSFLPCPCGNTATHMGKLACIVNAVCFPIVSLSSFCFAENRMEKMGGPKVKNAYKPAYVSKPSSSSSKPSGSNSKPTSSKDSKPSSSPSPSLMASRANPYGINYLAKKPPDIEVKT